MSNYCSHKWVIVSQCSDQTLKKCTKCGESKMFGVNR